MAPKKRLPLPKQPFYDFINKIVLKDDDPPDDDVAGRLRDRDYINACFAL